VQNVKLRLELPHQALDERPMQLDVKRVERVERRSPNRDPIDDLVTYTAVLRARHDLDPVPSLNEVPGQVPYVVP
jgi:hypothetical protein